MRFIYVLILLLIIAAIAIFAVQNNESVHVLYLSWSISWPLSGLIAAAYLLGMVSGWTVVGALKRTFQRATERHTD